MLHSGREISDTAAQDRRSRPESSRQLAARARNKNQHLSGRSIMTRSSAVCRHVLFAGALGTILVATSWPLVAQQPTASPPPSTSTAAPAALPAPTMQSVLADRPKSEAAQKLAPVTPPPIATAADKIPVDKLKAPKGFKIDVYATGMVNARSLREGDKGTIFVSSRLSDKIYAIIEKNGSRRAKPVPTACPGQTASSSTTARCTSPSCRRSRRPKTSKTSSTK